MEPPGKLYSAEMDDIFHIKLWGPLLERMATLEPNMHKKYKNLGEKGSSTIIKVSKGPI